MKKIIIAVAIVLSVIIAVSAFLIYSDNAVDITKTDYVNEKIPKSFDNYRIVQLSDLHNKLFGQNQKNLIEKVKSLKPDIIVFTGDIVSRKDEKTVNAQIFIEELLKISPVYYIEGNHEKYSPAYHNCFLPFLYGSGVTVLWNDCIELKKNNDTVSLIGLRDITAVTSYGYSSEKRDEVFSEWLTSSVKKAKSDFKILLSHRPEYFEKYSQSGVDLVLSGHAHGGQVILPFIGGVYAPEQGFRPEYYSGLYKYGNCTMNVNRGLGNSDFPFRINNHPEITLITLNVS